VELAPHIWFVRSNGGSGSYPVRPEGWRVVRAFVIGLSTAAVAATALIVVGVTSGTQWLIWLGAFVLAGGAGWSAWRFIDAARKHTDYSITYNDYVKARKNA